MYELASQLVCATIAAALSTTVAVVRGLLRLNPHWLERVDVLAAHLRAVASGGQSDRDEEVGADSPAPDPEADTLATTKDELRKILSAYELLWEYVQSLKAKGLGFDEDFRTKVEREWSVSTLLSYLVSVERTIQDTAEEAQATAARVLRPPQP